VAARLKPRPFTEQNVPKLAPTSPPLRTERARDGAPAYPVALREKQVLRFAQDDKVLEAVGLLVGLGGADFCEEVVE